jgi:hypothetical protein
LRQSFRRAVAALSSDPDFGVVCTFSIIGLVVSVCVLLVPPEVIALSFSFLPS